MTLIVDAGPLISMADERDWRGPGVTRLLAGEPGVIVVPAPVTAEVDYLLGKRVGRNAQKAFLRDLMEGSFTVECLQAEDYRVISLLAERYSGLNPGLADLSVVALAGRFRTTRILTFDRRHFGVIRPLFGTAFDLLPEL